MYDYRMNVMKVFCIVSGYIIGAKLGWPISGLLVGWYIGRQFDRSIHRQRSFFHFEHTPAQTVFFKATFSVMGHIAKADGHISDNEIKTAKHIMNQMRMNTALKKEAIAAFRLGKSNKFVLEEALTNLRSVAMLQPALIQLFIDIQMTAAKADGFIGPNKKRVLEQVIRRLGGQQQQSWQPNASQANQTSLKEACDLLGVKLSDSEQTIKKAYRKLMGQYHPDRMVSKGLPEEMIKMANTKTQEIKKAYETICQYKLKS